MKTKNKIKLVSVNADAKTSKGSGKGWLTGIVYLAPYTVAGLGNMCPKASEGCKSVCLFTAGRAAIFKAINEARIARTQFLVHDRAGFRAQLEAEIKALVRKAERENLQPAFRFNGTSDLAIEKLFPGLIESFPGVQFYDYTKLVSRALDYAAGKLPSNYQLTFSLSEVNANDAQAVIERGVNVSAVVDRIESFPVFLINGKGYNTVNGDESDLRFLDAREEGPTYPSGLPFTGKVVLLKAKGRAKKDTTGFVRRGGSEVYYARDPRVV
jgi:hypothetical protein